MTWRPLLLLLAVLAAVALAGYAGFTLITQGRAINTACPEHASIEACQKTLDRLIAADAERVVDGRPGKSGVQGLHGERGRRGPRGARGRRGPRGSTGPRGPGGANGADGRNGKRGARGRRGRAGNRGHPGRDGKNGLSLNQNGRDITPRQVRDACEDFVMGTPDELGLSRGQLRQLCISLPKS